MVAVSGDDGLVFGEPVAKQTASAGRVVCCEGNLVGIVAGLAGSLSRFFSMLGNGAPKRCVEFIDGQIGGGCGRRLQQNEEDGDAP